MSCKVDAIKSFYNTIPDDIYAKCIFEMKYPKARKKFIKQPKEQQLKDIMDNDSNQLAFINELAKHYRNDFNTNKFNEQTLTNIINNITARNCEHFHCAMVYIIKERGFYNKLEFDEFLLSDKFEDCIKCCLEITMTKKIPNELVINNEVFEETTVIGTTLDVVVNNELMRDDTTTNNQGNKPEIINRPILKSTGVFGVKKYFCRIEKIDSYNGDLFIIEPLYNIDGAKILDIDGDDKHLFGDTGKMKITGLKNLPAEKIKTCKFYIGDINDRDIFLLPEDIYGDKKAQIYENKIILRDPDDEQVYEVFEIREDIDTFKKRDKRVLDTKVAPLSKTIYIESKSYIYGAFKWNYNSDDEIEVSVSNTTHAVNYCKISSVADNIYYIPPREGTYDITRKVIHRDDALVAESTIDFIDNVSLKNAVIKNIASSRSEKDNIRKTLNSLENAEISEERKDRIRTLFDSESVINETMDEIISEILSDEKKTEKIVNIITNNSDYIEKIENKLSLNEKIEAKKDEEKDLQNKVNSLKNEIKEKEQLIDEQEAKQKAEISSQIQKENCELQLQRDNLATEIEILKNKMNVLNGLEEAERRAKNAEDDYKTFSRRQDNLEKIEKEFSTRFTDNVDEQIKNAYSKIVFEPIIANKVLAAARNYEKINTNDKVSVIATSDKISNYIAPTKKELIAYVHGLVHEYREISRNDIVNILLCISQGFITFFAGSPGTGKTSLCDILSNVLGLSHQENNRYIEISVEKGWTSKRDFIGYYNPLSKSFDKTNAILYNAFNILNQEEQESVYDFPYIVMLDEANLSSMEHYWADFMNVCDFDKCNRQVVLGEDTFKIPRTLRFLATINYDHTTEILSPRLIDRSWIVLLECEIDSIHSLDLYNKELKVNSEILSFKNIEKLTVVDEKNYEDDDDMNKIMSMFDKIYKKCHTMNISISPRVIRMIKKYCFVGKDLFDGDKIYTALDYAVAQKVLPLVNGYGEDYKNFLASLRDECKNTLPKCYSILEKIINTGDSNMQYYQFFVK